MGIGAPAQQQQPHKDDFILEVGNVTVVSYITFKTQIQSGPLYSCY
jgi:hypothetical protein